MPQTLAWIESAVAARAPRQICTANPEFIMAARRDPEFRQVLNAADLVLPDGVGLLWAARRLGASLPERVPGSDLIYRLSEQAAAHGWRIYFLGAAEGVAAAAAERLRAVYPGLVIAGAYSGSPRPERTRRRISAGCGRRGPIFCWWRTARPRRISGSRGTGRRWACR